MINISQLIIESIKAKDKIAKVAYRSLKVKEIDMKIASGILKRWW